LFKLIREDLRRGAYAVIVFGSQVKGTATKRSDVDLLVINKNGQKEPRFSKYETLFNVVINPIYITKREFGLMLKEREETVGKQVVKDHVVLCNPSLFWGEVANTWK
jgi:predicted nucleotidyltransferase